MKPLFRSILLVAVFLFTGLEVSAQCSNIDSPSAKNMPNTQVFASMSFGQSISGSCFTGSQIGGFSFWSQGNSRTKMDLKIYEGSSQTDSGTPLYTETGIELPPANFGGKLTVNFKSPVAVKSNKVYTFIFTGAGGNLIAHISDDKYSGGQFYLNKDGSGGFNANYDLRFEIEDVPSMTCANIKATFTVGKVTSETIEIIVEKEASGMFTIFPPDTGGTILEFSNVNHSLTRADGVGPQAGSSPGKWVVQRADASKPATMKFKNGGACAGKTLTLLK